MSRMTVSPYSLMNLDQFIKSYCTGATYALTLEE